MNNPSDRTIMAQLLQAVRRQFALSPAQTDDLGTALPWLGLVRRRSPTAAGRGMLQPSLCLLVQGEKEMLVGERVLRYSAGSYVQAGVAIPVSGRIVEASEDAPYYGVRIDLDPKEIAAFMLEMQMRVPADQEDAPAVTVEPAGELLLDAFLRLIRLLDRPRDVQVLGRLLKQEILYHLLSAPGGVSLSRGLLGGQREHAVARAITWIHEHYDEPLKIAELADQVHLSSSVLHRRFKAATLMSPLQYQKQMRLLEARRLLMSGTIEAASVAFQVGYESPSQFSREYRRLFGAPPLQDAQHLREPGVDPLR